MRKITLKKNTTLTFIFYLFLIFPFFKPMYLTTIPIVNTLYNGLQILNFLIIIIITIKDRKLSKVNALIFIFITILILSTFLNNGNLEEVITSSIRTLSLCFLIDNALRKNPKEFLLAFELLLGFLITINMFTLFLFPDGMYISHVSGYKSNWFLGFKNSHILYILPTLLLSIINSYINSERISKRTIIFFLIAIVSLIKVWSATSLVAIFMVAIFLVFNKFFRKHNLNFKFLITTYLVTFFSIIVLRIQNVFRYFIVEILNKDLTFTGRIYIWDYIIDYIKSKPILGYGNEYSAFRFSKGYNFHSYHAHNIILEILYQTGICGFIVICFIIGAISKKLEEFKTNMITKTITFFLFIYLVMMLMEAFNFEYFFFLFPLSYGIPYLIQCEKTQKERKIYEEVMA